MSPHDIASATGVDPMGPERWKWLAAYNAAFRHSQQKDAEQQHSRLIRSLRSSRGKGWWCGTPTAIVEAMLGYEVPIRFAAPHPESVDGIVGFDDRRIRSIFAKCGHYPGPWGCITISVREAKRIARRYHGQFFLTNREYQRQQKALDEQYWAEERELVLRESLDEFDLGPMEIELEDIEPDLDDRYAELAFARMLDDEDLLDEPVPA